MVFSLQQICMSLQSSIVDEKVMNLVDQSTEMYWQNQYEACVALLNDCIILQPNVSALFSNRAVAYYHMKEKENSLLDLQRAVKINHLNFIAYFNMFSVYFLNKDHAQCFQNLCFCLSSAYTYLCRSQKQLTNLNKSIYYSFNNKQSMFMKAIFLLQKNNQLQQSLQLLKQCLQYQNTPTHKRIIFALIQKIQKTLNIISNKDDFLQQTKQSDESYQLKTNVQYPQGQKMFSERIVQMLKQFNMVYRRMIEMNMQINIQNNQSPFLQMKSDNNSIKDKQSIKTRNNTLIDLDVISMNQYEKDVTKNHSCLSNLKELNILSVVNHQSTNNIINNHHQTNFSNNKSKFEFSFKSLKFHQSGCNTTKYNNLYLLILPQTKSKNSNYMTSLKKIKDGQCSWQSQNVILNISEGQCMKIKILNKRFSQFQDELISQLQLQTISIGYFSLTFSCVDKQGGTLLVKIQQSQ